jgi:hypothetical protein
MGKTLSHGPGTHFLALFSYRVDFSIFIIETKLEAQ